MIRVAFFEKEGYLRYLEITGHSTADAEDSEGKLVCAAVSSAAIMAANTVTEIIGDTADITVQDGALSMRVQNAGRTAEVLQGLKLHLMELQREYPERIKVIMEVEP